jgi:phenylalanine ammonia-lyase
MENFNILHGGNFLGEYVAIGMDQVRNYIGLIAKHLDAQIALLVMPEFNNGLPSSLSGNTTNRINMGLKGLQITGNSIMPLLLFYGNSIADKFPTHAEQFNQNINSQGFNASMLTKTSIELFRKYVAISLIFAVQAVDLRAKQMGKQVYVKDVVSPETFKTYAAIRQICNKNVLLSEPLVINDNSFPMDDFIDAIDADIQYNGKLVTAANALIEKLDAYYAA